MLLETTCSFDVRIKIALSYLSYTDCVVGMVTPSQGILNVFTEWKSQST